MALINPGSKTLAGGVAHDLNNILGGLVTDQDYISQLQPVIDVYGIGLAVIEELEKSAISGPLPTIYLLCIAAL